MKALLNLSILIALNCSAFCQWVKIYDFDYAEPEINDIEISIDETLYLAVKGFIHKSSTNGLSWESYPVGSNDIRSITFTGTDTGYALKALGDGVGIAFKTINSGDEWILITPSSEYWPENNDFFVFQNESIITVGGAAIGYIQAIDSNFENVDIIYPDITEFCYSSIDCRNYDTCICIVGDQFGFNDGSGSILFTENHGGEWTQKGIINEGRDVSIQPNGSIYALGYFQLLKSINNGESWSTLKMANESYNGEFRAMKFLNDSVGYLCEVFHSYDSVAIYRTENGGISWNITQFSELPTSVSAIDCIDPWICFFGTNAGEIFKTENGGTAIYNYNNDLLNNYFIYPNPASNTISINGNLNKVVKIETYNYQNQKVDLDFFNGLTDINKLSDGYYYTLLFTTDNVYYMKWIKV